MRKFIALISFIILSGMMSAQTVRLQEDFESLPLDFTSSGTVNWDRSSNLQVSGLYSDSASLALNTDTAILTSISFNTTGDSYVYLEFDQICKVSFFESGRVELSVDNGTTWTQIPAYAYRGSGQYSTIGNRFAAVSYVDWMPADAAAIPQNSWWKHEKFDVSTLVGDTTHVMLRFILLNTNGIGGGSDYGWLIDNVKVISSNSELDPPMTEFVAPFVKDTIYHTGPYEIRAKMKDNSGIDTAFVVYTYNNVTDTIGMDLITTDTSNFEHRMALLPSMPFDSSFCYQVTVIDASMAANVSRLPGAVCQNVVIVRPTEDLVIGDGGVASYAAPLYNDSVDGSKKYSEHIGLYTAQELNNREADIIELAWKKMNKSGYTKSNSTLKIYLKHTNADTISTAAGSFATAKMGATLVYDSTAVNIIADTGMVNFAFNKSTFHYDGTQNVLILVEWHRPDTLTAARITWQSSNKIGRAVSFAGSSSSPTAIFGLGQLPNVVITTIPTLLKYDVGVTEINSPNSIHFTNSTTDISVRVKNYGTDTIDKMNIHYSLDGGPTYTYAWTGLLNIDLSSPLILIDSKAIPKGAHSITSWTSMPNDSNDMYSSNDSITKDFYICNQLLSGSYTVGGSTADFANFDEVQSQLNNCGISNAVTFYINPGNYNENIHLMEIPGASASNTVTFVSSTGNAADVLIAYEAISSSDNYLVNLEGANWVRFKNISFKALKDDSPIVIHLSDSSQHNIIDHCIFEVPNSSSGQSYGVFAEGPLVSNNEFSNNKLTGFYHSFHLASALVHTKGNIIKENEILDFGHSAIYSIRQDDLSIINNTIKTVNTFTYGTGMYVSGSEGELKIIGNTLDLELTGSVKGMSIKSVNAVAGNDALIANNFVSVYGVSTTDSRSCFEIDNSNNVNIYHNSFALHSGGNLSRTVYINYNQGINLVNNIYSNFNQGHCFEVATSATSGAINNSDYNSYYSAGVTYGKWGYNSLLYTSSGVASLTALSSMDSNSVFTNPNFYSKVNLHSFSAVLDAAAKPNIGVISDIDGDLRSTTTPDIGADEYVRSSIDVGVIELVNPLPLDTQSRVTSPQVIVRNFGVDTVTSMLIKYQVDGGAIHTYTYNDTLAYSATDTVTLPQFTVPVLNYSLIVYTQLLGDTIQSNDTLKSKRYGMPIIDVEAVSLVGPDDACGMGANEEVTIKIRNKGLHDIQSGLSVSYQIMGSSTVVTETISDTLLVGADMDYTFNTKADLTVGNQDSLFVFDITTMHTSDPIGLNNHAVGKVLSLGILPAPIASDTTINYGTSAVLTAYSPNNIVWYENDTSQTSIASGSAYTTPLLFDTTTYYVESNSNIPAMTKYLGQDTTTNTAGALSCVYHGGGATHQILIRANELQAMGMQAGNITSIAFYIESTNYNTPHAQFTIKMANTTASSLTTNYITTGLVEVFKAGFTEAQGWNVHNFTTPFIWDGTSNVVIDLLLFTNYSNPLLTYSPTSYNSVAYNVPLGGGIGVSTERPNMRFTTDAILGCAGARTPLIVNVPPPTIEAEMLSVGTASESCGLDTTEVECAVVNMGSDTIPLGFTLSYQIDNGAFISPETVGQSIAPQDTLHYTFTTKANLPSGAIGTTYSLTAAISVPNDFYNLNDSLTLNDIWSEYTPVAPIIASTPVIPYTDTVHLSATSNDTVYWYYDALGSNAIGDGASFDLGPLYDTTIVYANAVKTVPLSPFIAGTGTSSNTNSQGPAPFGGPSYQAWGVRNQFLIPASELRALGMLKGEITSLAFNITTVSGNSHDGYTIKIGATAQNELNSFEPASNLTTIYTSVSTGEVLGWNTYTFATPYYWDGVSNIVIETCYKNTQWVTSGYAQGPYTNTSYVSSLSSYSGSNFSCTDTIKDNSYHKRPNIKFMAKGYGSCASPMSMHQVDVSGIPSIDVGIVDIVSPLSNISGCQAEDIKVVLKNFGTNTITSANINWKDRDNVVHTYAWTGSLATSDVDTVTVANHQFYGGATRLFAWSSMPNAVNDTILINDTSFMDLNVSMNGTYTVGAGMDYPSLIEAFDDLELSTICGPVVIDIDTGSYLNKYELHAITGASASNTITIKSIANDSSMVHFTYGTNLIDNYVLKLNGAQHIIIKHITFNANGNNTSNAIWLTGNTKYVSIENCVLNSAANASTGAAASGVYATGGDVGYISIKNNQINNGYSSVYFQGTFSNRQKGIHIHGNKMMGFNYAGVYANYMDSIMVDNNEIVSGLLGNQNYGIYLKNTQNSYKLRSNSIIINPAMTGTGMYILNVAGIPSDKGIVSNNMVVISSGTATNRGVYLWNTVNTDLVYNSINVLAGLALNSGIKVQSGSNLNILNNAIATEKGRIVDVNIASAITLCDYNNYYTDTLINPFFIKWVGEVASLSALKTIDPNNNAHAISVNPSFYSNTDLHSYEFMMDAAATPISHTLVDIDGDVRDASNPDIGADEFTLYPIDLGLIKMSHPDQSGCSYSSTDSLVVKVRNYGTSNIDFSITPATIVVYSTGVNPDTITYVLSSGIIPPNSYMDVKVSNNYDLTVTGTYTFDANITIAGDGNSLNDDMPSMDFVSYNPIIVFPFTENFESGNSFYLATDAGSETSMIISSDAGVNSNLGMRFAGGDNSSFVPNTTVAQAYSHTQHVASLYSCDIDATNLSALNLRFDLKQAYFANPYGSWFRVIISDANGDHYAKNTNGDSTFRAQTNNSDPFVNQTFILNNYVGQVISVRLEAALGASIHSNGQGDIAYVDNIYIWSPVNTDISMNSIGSLEKAYFKTGTIHYPRIVVENFGVSTITSVPISYSVNGQAPQWDTITTNIQSLMSDTLTMNKSIMIQSGVQNLCIIAHLPGDMVALNDTVCADVKGINVFGINYEDDFEGNDEWFAKGTYTQWAKGIPNSTNFTSANSGTQVYATVLDGDYQASADEYLYSPYFNIPNTTDTVTMDFVHKMQVLPQLAYGFIQYTFNGTLWLDLGYIGATHSTNWYNTNINGKHAWSFQSNSWLASSFQLDPSQFKGKEVQFRFVFKSLTAGSSADGWMIDDWKLTLPPQQFDAGVTQILLPDTNSTSGIATTVTVEIHNYGYGNLTQVPVNYKVDGIGKVVENWTGLLLPDSSTSYTFTTTYLSPKGTYNICSHTQLSTDANTSNDGLCKSLHGDAPDWDAAVVDINEQYAASGNIVKIRVANLGNNPIVNLPVQYKYGSLAAVQESLSTTLNPGDTIVYTFNQPASIYAGITLLCGKSLLANDMEPSNNEFCKATTGVSDVQKDKLILKQNQPNPFSSTTRIAYSVPKPGDVQFRVTNTLGVIVFEECHRDVNGTYDKEYNFSFLSPGIYYYSIIYEGRMITKKMIIR